MAHDTFVVDVYFVVISICHVVGWGVVGKAHHKEELRNCPAPAHVNICRLMMLFYSTIDQSWEKALYWVWNVLVGCILARCGLVATCGMSPRPKVLNIDVKFVNQIELVVEVSVEEV